MKEERSDQIRLILGEQILTATLEKNLAARDFLEMLPLDLVFNDYAGTEKVSELPGRLNTGNAPDGISAKVGDLTYYAPWGNLAIFYRDFLYASGLLRLGRINGNIELLETAHTVRIRIEKI